MYQLGASFRILILVYHDRKCNNIDIIKSIEYKD